jgi:hypothetical protein
MIRILALWIALGLSGTQAFAEGDLRLSVTGSGNFLQLQVHEHNGAREGNVTATWGGGYVYAKTGDQQLLLTMGDIDNPLQMHSMGKSTLYAGTRWWTRFTHSQFKHVPNGEKGFRIFGKIGLTSFTLDSNFKKKTLTLDWDNVYLTIAQTEEPGTCKGELWGADGGQSEKLGTLHCESSGKLQDAIFKNPDDAIAWLIHLFINPRE